MSKTIHATLTGPQWDAIASAVALASCEWEHVDPQRVAVLERAWDALCDGKARRVSRYSPEFERFWEVYGKVGPKPVAAAAFAAAVKRGHSPETIIDGLLSWNAYWSTPGAAAMKWPQGFLNQDYFLSEPPAVRVEQTRRAMPGRSGIEAALARRSQQQRLGSGQLELEGGAS